MPGDIALGVAGLLVLLDVTGKLRFRRRATADEGAQLRPLTAERYQVA